MSQTTTAHKTVLWGEFPSELLERLVEQLGFFALGTVTELPREGNVLVYRNNALFYQQEVLRVGYNPRAFLLGNRRCEAPLPIAWESFFRGGYFELNTMEEDSFYRQTVEKEILVEYPRLRVALEA